MTRCVVKVGGSLYDWPDLGPRLRCFLDTLDAGRVLFFPGGGPTADAIRTLDRTHRLGEEAAHWLALQALSVNAGFLAHLLSECELLRVLPGPDGGRLAVIDPYPVFRADDEDPGRFPHRWDVTSDSLAVRAAVLAGADELWLLKSASWDGRENWGAAARSGLVDGFFPEALGRAGMSLRVKVLNLRVWPGPRLLQ